MASIRKKINEQGYLYPTMRCPVKCQCYKGTWDRKKGEDLLLNEEQNLGQLNEETF